MRCRFTVSLAVLGFGLAAFTADRASADDKAPFNFPTLDGWELKGRFDPPSAPATFVCYGRKGKVGDRANGAVRITVPGAGGKTVADALPGFEKTILEDESFRDAKKAETAEYRVGKTGIAATRVTFTGHLSGDAFDRVLVVAPVGGWFLKFEFDVNPGSRKERTATVEKLIEAVVEAATAK
jgi:hypothetical protein